jgi:hypothetical protein
LIRWGDGCRGCGSAELLMAEIFSAELRLRASNYLFFESSVCATAIIVMFFQQCLIHLVTDCYCVRASNDR